MPCSSAHSLSYIALDLRFISYILRYFSLFAAKSAAICNCSLYFSLSIFLICSAPSLTTFSCSDNDFLIFCTFSSSAANKSFLFFSCINLFFVQNLSYTFKMSSPFVAAISAFASEYCFSNSIILSFSSSVKFLFCSFAAL